MRRDEDNSLLIRYQMTSSKRFPLLREERREESYCGVKLLLLRFTVEGSTVMMD